MIDARKTDIYLKKKIIFQKLVWLSAPTDNVLSCCLFQATLRQRMYQRVCARVENTWVALFIVYTLLLSPVYGRANRIKQFVSHRNRRRGYNQFTWTLTSNRISHTTNTSVTDIQKGFLRFFIVSCSCNTVLVIYFHFCEHCNFLLRDKTEKD